jgi:cell division protein FtsI/penicillin-binding protein 2
MTTEMTSDKAHSIDSRRVILLALVLTFGFAVIVGQLVRYQIVEHPHLREISDQQALHEQPIVPSRGRITDVNGHLLALDIVEWEVSADPPLIIEKDRTANQLAPLLQLPELQVKEVLSSTAPWVLLKKQVPQEVGESIRDLNLNGVECNSLPLRVYPQADLTAHVVGFVNDTREGFYGVEGFYNQQLKPVEGVIQILQNPVGEPIPAAPKQESPGRPGTSLVLALDINIQYIAQEELMRALEEFDAQSGTVIVMEPHTGALLALFSYPSYDPNSFATAEPGTISNPSVSGMWEPGSMFKLMTWAAALDLGTITPDTVFYDTPCTEVGGRSMCNWDRKGHGYVTATQALAQSLNVVAAQISTGMGAERFYTYLRRFGFGSLTDVDLASESPGMVRRPGDSNWFPSDLGANAFGQGIAVTPIQMITAVAAIANGGLLTKPHAVEQFVTPEENGQGARVIRFQPTVTRRAISEKAAKQLTDMMVFAVDSFTAKAQIPGYRIAGKSSTAQIPTAYGYDPTDTIASYVGFAPADNPRFVILVKLDRPKSSEWGTQTAAPTFRAIAERLFLYLKIPPDSVRLAQNPQ